MVWRVRRRTGVAGAHHVAGEEGSEAERSVDHLAGALSRHRAAAGGDAVVVCSTAVVVCSATTVVVPFANAHRDPVAHVPSAAAVLRSPASVLQCSTFLHVSSTSPTILLHSTALQYSASTALQCSTSSTLQCSTSTALQCSTSTTLQCSTSSATTPALPPRRPLHHPAGQPNRSQQRQAFLLLSAPYRPLQLHPVDSESLCTRPKPHALQHPATQHNSLQHPSTTSPALRLRRALCAVHHYKTRTERGQTILRVRQAARATVQVLRVGGRGGNGEAELRERCGVLQVRTKGTYDERVSPKPARKEKGNDPAQDEASDDADSEEVWTVSQGRTHEEDVPAGEAADERLPVRLWL